MCRDTFVSLSEATLVGNSETLTREANDTSDGAGAGHGVGWMVGHDAAVCYEAGRWCTVDIANTAHGFNGTDLISNEDLTFPPCLKLHARKRGRSACLHRLLQSSPRLLHAPPLLPGLHPHSWFVAMAENNAGVPANGTAHGADKKIHDRPQANPDAVDVAKLAGGKPDPAANTAELDKLAKSIDTVQKELVSLSA